MFDPPFLKKYNNLRLKRSGNEIEFQEVFFDKLVEEKEQRAGELFERKLEVPLPRWILWGLYLSFLGVALLFLGETFQLQVFAGKDLSAKARQNTVRSFPFASQRGVIYDGEMKQLVFNKPSFDFVCDRRYLPENRQEKERILRQASRIADIPFENLKTDFDKGESPEFLARENLSHEQLILFETKKEELEGCGVEKNTMREYVQMPSLSHILGYTAKISPEELRSHPDYFVVDQVGKTGVEKSYEALLRGNPGKILIEKDALGKVVREKGEVASEPGKSLVLWLDFELQQKIEEALAESLQSVGAKKAVGVALDPTTGGVLSLVGIPGFDNNLFSQGISRAQYEEIIANPLKPLFNRAIAGLYPTGSTIKPLIAAAALAENIIDPGRQVLTNGFIEIPNQYDPEIVYRFPDWKNHGWVDMRDSIAVSSNVYFYMIGGGYEDQEGLGPSRIKKYLSLFGWGDETGIDLPGEAEGLIPDPAWKKKAKNEGWWDGDTYLLSIGQGNLLATPLQVAAAFVPIANGGTLYQPRMVKEIVETGEDPIKISSAVVRDDFMRPEDLKVVREGMKQAVDSGSSVMLDQLPVEAAAKTGTAQTGKKDAEGKDYLYSWVTVFAPYDNPEIVLTILVEDVKEGSIAVLPAAKKVLEWYFTRE